MAKTVMVYWRDIPSQVIVQRGRRREKMLLSARFQEAIDRAAMRAGKGSSDAYLEEWRRVTDTIDNPSDLGRWLQAKIAGIEAAFSDDRLNALIKSHGREEA